PAPTGWEPWLAPAAGVHGGGHSSPEAATPDPPGAPPVIRVEPVEPAAAGAVGAESVRRAAPTATAEPRAIARTGTKTNARRRNRDMGSSDVCRLGTHIISQ